MEQVLSVYERPYDANFPVVCMDESPKQVIDYKEFIGKDGKQYQDSEYIRKGVVELFVATEPLAGFRQLTVEDDHKASTWVLFMVNLMDTVYKDAIKVTWVMDNFCTHKLSFFYEYFTPKVAKAYIDRMEIVHTPVHGSWLNMAEIEFAALSIQCLDRRIPNKEMLVKEVKAWELNRNHKAVKINWSFTTDLAQQKLARHYCNVFNNY